MSLVDFPLELDHIAFISQVDAPEAEVLEKIGLVRFSGTTQHTGLGTASTSFFFENIYLELLWAHDAELAMKKFQPLGLDLDARARWQDTFACPFGVMLRRKAGRRDAIPFATKQFTAEWMPTETIVHFNAEQSGEPYYGIVPENLGYPSFKETILNRDHALGVKNVTAVKISVYGDLELSPVARLLEENSIVNFKTAPYANLEIEFDRGTQDEAINLRPDLPIVLKY